MVKKNSSQPRRKRKSGPPRPRRSRKAPSKKGRSRLRNLFGPVLLLTLVASLCLGGGGIHYYGKFNRLLEARLEAGRPVQTQVYSRPEVLLQGQRTSRDTVVDRLLDLSYKPRPEPGRPWFEATPDAILLSHKSGQEQVRLHFNGDRISRIIVNDRPVLAVELEPQFLTSLFGEKRQQQKLLSFAEIPRHLLQAVLAAEDSRFFQHPGIDLWGIARAAVTNLVHWERRQGGSTLTQQFIKNYFLSPEKKVLRKLEEISFSFFLERRMTKQQIFQLYANEVYLGQVGTFAIIGFGQGARVYFGKPIEQLSLADSATLASIIPAPNRYSPYRAPDEVLRRRNQVLSRMEEMSWISTRENAEARRMALGVIPPSRQNFAVAPYFVDFVSTSELTARGRQADDSLFIHTALDPFLQKIGYEAVAEGLDEVRKRLARRHPQPRPQAALLAADPRTGEILAMIGGQDYARVQFNHATNGQRQPGSTFKPFVYAALLEESRGRPQPTSLASLVVDEPFSFPFGKQMYRPRNYRDKYYGVVSVREALAKSLNVPAVKLAQEVGLEKVRQYALEFGFNDSIKAYPSLALGAFEVSLLELVQGYQVLANGGLMIPLNSVRGVEIDGVKEVVSVSAGKRVISRAAAFLVASALRSTLDEGTGRAARSLGFRLPAAGKTGSTEDSWFVGFTPEIVCGVWLGSESEAPLDLSGASAALPVWTSFMKRAQEMDYFAGREPQKPEGIVTLQIDPETGLRSSAGCPKKAEEFFLPGTEPSQTCQVH